VEVQPMMDGGFGPDGGMNGGGGVIDGGEVPVVEPEVEQTLWQKVVRFFRGLLGLGSDVPEPSVPVDGGPVIEEPAVRPVVPNGKGG
jgi:hypothetical protein